MSTWWDERVGRYRRSLPHKLLFVWCWPVVRRCLFLLPSETAHVLCVHYGFWLVDCINRAWQMIVAVGVFLLLAPLMLIAKLPGFSWKEEP